MAKNRGAGSTSSFVGLTTFGGSHTGSAWKPASTGIHGKATSGAAQADRLRCATPRRAARVRLALASCLPPASFGRPG